MNSMDILWIFGYFLLLLISDFLYSRIITYIEDKPLGFQSLFDMILRDHFWVMRMNGKIYCFVAIASRLEFLLSLYKSNSFVLTFICSVFEFAFSSTCVSTGIYFLVAPFCTRHHRIH